MFTVVHVQDVSLIPSNQLFVCLILRDMIGIYSSYFRNDDIVIFPHTVDRVVYRIKSLLITSQEYTFGISSRQTHRPRKHQKP